MEHDSVLLKVIIVLGNNDTTNKVLVATARALCQVYQTFFTQATVVMNSHHRSTLPNDLDPMA